MSIRFAITGAIGNEGVIILNDTGSANLTSITIGKLGSADDDGQPITVTYSDGSTLTPNRQAVNDDGTNRNEVLNNDEVVYNVNLDVTNLGQITLVFTMPANSTISEASVASVNGCLQGSKVGRQSTVGSDGESSPSYTNNQATCVINPGSAKSLTWSVSTNPWVGDGEQIRPSLTISGQAPTGQSPQSMPVVTTIGRGDYGITVYTEATNSAANGLDRTIYPSFGIYGKKADQTGALGLAPLSSDGDWVLRVNTSNLPAGWTVASTTTRYLGSELSLILDKSTLSTTLEPGATDTLTNTITLNARTSRGYNLTMQSNTANGELAGDSDRLIPTIAKPGDDLAGNDGRWAVRVQGSNNLAEIPNSGTRLPIPGQAQPPLSLYSTTIPGLDSDRQLTAIYEVLAGPNSIAGNYRATVTYTLTAGL